LVEAFVALEVPDRPLALAGVVVAVPDVVQEGAGVARVGDDVAVFGVVAVVLVEALAAAHVDEVEPVARDLDLAPPLVQGSDVARPGEHVPVLGVVAVILVQASGALVVDQHVGPIRRGRRGGRSGASQDGYDRRGGDGRKQKTQRTFHWTPRRLAMPHVNAY